MPANTLLNPVLEVLYDKVKENKYEDTTHSL